MEPVDPDEKFSWSAATVIMLLFSLFAGTTTLLAMNPFSLLFNIALIYLPTVILIGSAVFGKASRAS